MFMKRRGITLVVSLIILLLLTFLGASILILSLNDEEIVSDKIRHIRSRAYAEAGVSEAIRRLSLDSSDSLYIGDPNYHYNPAWTIYILLTIDPPVNNPPVYYVSSVQMSLPDSQRFDYTTEKLDLHSSLVVHHKINLHDSSQIFYYNWEKMCEESHDPSTYNGTFFPIQVIEATGTVWNAQRKIRVEVARKATPVNIAAALSCDSDIEIIGDFVCCGHEHLFTTPWGTDAGINHYECFDDPDDPNDPVWHVHRYDEQQHANKQDNYEKNAVDMRCSQVGCKPGISAPEHTINLGGRSDVSGNPDWTNDPTVANFYYLYQILGASSWEDLEVMFPWQNIGPGTIAGGNFTGFYKCEGDLYLSEVTNFTGVLWVTGKIKQTGHFFARGLIYSQLDMQFNGNVWILGAVATEGDSHITIRPFNGSGVLLYSSKAIQRAIAQGYGYSVISRSEE